MICPNCRTDKVPSQLKEAYHRKCSNNRVPKSCDCQHRTDRKTTE